MLLIDCKITLWKIFIKYYGIDPCVNIWVPNPVQRSMESVPPVHTYVRVHFSIKQYVEMGTDI